MNIVLIGFMGSGKSKVGRELAKRLGMKYTDTDELIQKKERRSIPEIFAREGESYFRQIESEVVKEVSKLDHYVVSTGGGVVLNRENMQALKENGWLVCLKATPGAILSRIKEGGEERPLLKGFVDQKKRIQELLEKREPLYRQADFTIDTSFLAVSEIVDRIVTSLSQEKLWVRLRERSYPIFVGFPLAQVGKIAANFKLGRKILILSDRNVFPLYGEEVKTSLEEEGFWVTSLEIPPGERYKSLSQANRIYNLCLDFALDRTSSILALGGGVIGDLAGFVAATFLRGINFLVVPTTLLSQVDSSVGGKVGVNLPRGKNLVGSFYQPRFVLIDPQVLPTLSPRRMREGIAEVIKCAIIKNGDFFSYLEKNIDKALSWDFQTLRFIIDKAVRIKIKVVEEDEREEKKIREILNFGHTIGHAIETESRYRRYTHGEAVAIGMVGESRIAREMGLFPSQALERLKNLLIRAKLPIRARGLNSEKVFRALKVDKKIREGKQVFVLPQKIGRVSLIDNVSQKLVKKVIQELVR